jgi:hypothetical protein
MKKKPPSAEELRVFLAGVLLKRAALCRAAGLDGERTEKGRQWEIGRADAYTDFRAYLLELDLTAIK